MTTEECLAKYAREVHDLRLLLVLVMHMRAEDTIDPNDKDPWPATELDELCADWDDLAFSLTRQQWLTGVRAFDHFCNLPDPDSTAAPASKSQLNRLYRGYAAMKCTNYKPPRMQSHRLLKNGISMIRREFESGSVTPDARNQNPQCDKQGEQALSHEWSAVDIGNVGGL